MKTQDFHVGLSHCTTPFATSAEVQPNFTFKQDAKQAMKEHRSFLLSAGAGRCGRHTPARDGTRGHGCGPGSASRAATTRGAPDTGMGPQGQMDAGVNLRGAAEERDLREWD